jgi:hypothetical protein
MKDKSDDRHILPQGTHMIYVFCGKILGLSDWSLKSYLKI